MPMTAGLRRFGEVTGILFASNRQFLHAVRPSFAIDRTGVAPT